ncbi:MAG TPA: hypothetical protein VK530_19600 [Candidatus Acidoferrum sp.]|nr:hypothetical protein [Candidatus Acidoferrum sp.]
MNTRILRRCLIAVIVAAAMFQSQRAFALNIVWVSDNGPAGFSGPVATPASTADDAFTTNILANAGHNVIRYNPDIAGANALPAADLEALNTNDLIIIGRSIGSAAFTSQQANSWNMAVTKPVIVCSPYLTRTANLGWFLGANVPATASPTTLTVVDPNEVKSLFLFEGVALSGNVTTEAFDEPVDRNTSVTTDPTQGGGVVYARSVNVSVGTVIADWPTGAIIRSGTNTLAGYRMFFAAGSWEVSGVQTAGKDNLSPMGEQVFLRAVLLAANNGVPPNLVYDPVIIQTQPASVTNAENATATFSVALSQGTLPRYQWYSNDVAIGGATSSSFSLLATPSAPTNFFVIITNNAGAVTSSVAILTVLPDTNPPVVLGARAVSAHTVVVYFDEPVEPVSATDFNRYYIDAADGGVFFAYGAVMSGTTAVVLTLLDEYPPNLEATITVDAVKDRSAAMNAVSTNVALTPHGVARGNIVWVSDNGPIGFSGPSALTEDDAFTTNLLANAGYNVIRFNSDNVATTLLTPEQIEALNTNDLIIIGRASGSAPFLGVGQGSQWNTNITKPLITMSSYVVRNTALGWFTNDTLPDDTQTPLIGNTNSPLFSLLFGGIAMNGNTTIDPFDVFIDRSTSLIASAPANGVIIATAAQNGATAIAEFPAGALVRTNTEALAGYRMHFAGGTREANGGNINTSGKNNFTAIGELIFARAVQLALDKEQPAVLSPSFSGGTFSASIATRLNVTYHVEYKTELQSSSWIPLTNIVGDGALKQFTDENPVDPARYYRVIAE